MDIRNGKIMVVLFHTSAGKRVISCRFDSSRFDSPATQIIDENPGFFRREGLEVRETVNLTERITNPRRRRNAPLVLYAS